jgi:hypothetical protein
MTDGTKIRMSDGFSSVKLQRVVLTDEQTSWSMVATLFGSLGVSLRLTQAVWCISIIIVCNDTSLRLVNMHQAVYWTKSERRPICTIHAMSYLGFICRVCAVNSKVLTHLWKLC